MINVIHFIPSINCTSGIANMIMNYYRKINRKKFKFYFIYFLNERDKNFISEIELLGGKCFKIVPPSNFFEFKRQFKETLIKIDTMILDGDEKIFHNHQISYTIFLYNLTRKYFTQKIIVHNHLTKYSDKLLSAIRNFFLCIPIKYMKLNYFACSKDASKIIFGKKNIVHIINNAINIEKYRYNINSRKNIRKELNITEDTLVIGDIGRLEPQKNYMFVLKILKKIIKKNNSVLLLIVGKGYLKKKLDKYIIKNNMQKNVVFLQDRKDIPDILSAMDIFLFPSKFEGLGIVAVEAASSGLPIFLSNMIPDDVKIVNYIQLNLNENINIWVDKILNVDYKSANRADYNNIMLNTSFNIDLEVLKLEKIYQNIC